jgi:hypothetical protein
MIKPFTNFLLITLGCFSWLSGFLIISLLVDDISTILQEFINSKLAGIFYSFIISGIVNFCTGILIIVFAFPTVILIFLATNIFMNEVADLPVMILLTTWGISELFVRNSAESLIIPIHLIFIVLSYFVAWQVISRKT